MPESLELQPLVAEAHPQLSAALAVYEQFSLFGQLELNLESIRSNVRQLECEALTVALPKSKTTTTTITTTIDDGNATTASAVAEIVDKYHGAHDEKSSDEVDGREIINTILQKVRGSGCRWQYLHYYKIVYFSISAFYTHIYFFLFA